MDSAVPCHLQQKRHISVLTDRTLGAAAFTAACLLKEHIEADEEVSIILYIRS